MEQEELLFDAGRNANWYSHFGKEYDYFYKTKHYDSAIMLFVV
jgi:hypothetical protein